MSDRARGDDPARAASIDMHRRLLGRVAVFLHHDRSADQYLSLIRKVHGAAPTIAPIDSAQA
jgi:hypothetical protein